MERRPRAALKYVFPLHRELVTIYNYLRLLENTSLLDLSTQDCTAMVTQQEQAWIEGLRQGDADCYRQLVEAYIGPLLKVARRYLGEDDARDAVQEAFTKVHSCIRSFHEESRLLTWM